MASTARACVRARAAGAARRQGGGQKYLAMASSLLPPLAAVDDGEERDGDGPWGICVAWTRSIKPLLSRRRPPHPRLPRRSMHRAHARTHAGRDRGLWLNRVGPRFSLFDPFSLPHCDCDSDRTPTGQARQQHRTDRNSARGGRSIVPFCLCCAAYPPRLFFFPVLYRNFYVKLTAEIDFTTHLNSKFASKISCKFCMCTHKRCRCIYVPPQYMMFITE